MTKCNLFNIVMKVDVLPLTGVSLMATKTSEKAYPRSFIQRAKALHPVNSFLHQALDAGDDKKVELHLRGSSHGPPGSEILNLLDCGNIEELRRRAELAVRQSDLYSCWVLQIQKRKYW